MQSQPRNKKTLIQILLPTQTKFELLESATIFAQTDHEDNENLNRDTFFFISTAFTKKIGLS